MHKARYTCTLDVRIWTVGTGVWRRAGRTSYALPAAGGDDLSWQPQSAKIHTHHVKEEEANVRQCADVNSN